MTASNVTDASAVRTRYDTPVRMQGQSGSVALTNQPLILLCKLVLLPKKTSGWWHWVSVIAVVECRYLQGQ